MQEKLDFDGIKKKLQLIREEVEARIPDILTILVISGKALAERRIVDKGFGGRYSQNQVPAWWFKGKDLNQQGRDFLDSRLGAAPPTTEGGTETKGKKKGKGKKKSKESMDGSGTATWAEFRAVQGLQVAHVDLHYSNKMFASMGLSRIEQKGGRHVAYLGGLNEESVNKMMWNFLRYGNFLGKALTDEDFETLRQICIQELGNILDKFR